MTFFELLDTIKAKRIIITSSNNELNISAPVGTMTEVILQGIKKYKQNFLEILSAKIPIAAVKESYPLSPAQRRFWILNEFQGGSSAFNIPISLRISGNINVATIEEALNLLIGRHMILRTVFKENEQGEINQYIIPKWEYFTIEFKEEIDSEKALEFIESINATEFDLTRFPLIKIALCQVSENDYFLTIVMHHIISDGWSTKLFLNELLKTYFTLARKEEPHFPDTEIDFKDYAEWFSNELNTKSLDASENFWISQFRGEIPAIDLPISNKRPLLKTFKGADINSVFSEEIYSKLIAYSKEKGITVFGVLMTAVNCVLYRYSAQQQIILGIPISGRNQYQTSDVIGLMINSLPILTQIDENDTFETLLSKENKILYDAYAHQVYPFDLLIETLKVDRDSSRSPLFDIMVSFTKEEDAGEVLHDFHIEALSTKTTTCQFDLIFNFIETSALILSINFNTDLFEAHYIENLLKHTEYFLGAALNNPSQTIDSINFLSEDEMKKVCVEFNNTYFEYPQNCSIVDLIEQQVLINPDKEAVQFNSRSWDDVTKTELNENKIVTYSELSTLSNKIANILISEFSIAKGDMVALMMEKSEWMIPVLLGILKAGAVYVPIDPDYPEERKKYFEEITSCKLNINNDRLSEILSKIKNADGQAPSIRLDPDDLVHVMFTSGSTGKPKGVKISHKNIVGLVKPCNYMDLNQNTVLLSTVSVSFDTTNIEFWGIIMNGGKVILERKEFLMDYSKLKEIVDHYQVNTLFLTTSWFENVVENYIDVFENLQQFLTGGDVVSYKHVNLLKERFPKLDLIHVYGPTEDTTFSTFYKIEEKLSKAIPIGKPINNGKCFILNDSLIPQPVGVTGTLYLGGIGVSPGYFGNPELTEQKFIRNPFQETGDTIYNSNDLAKWMPDGNIDFIGRKDKQVKIRGKIIDTVEIENTLNSFDFINQAVVLVQQIKNEKKIVAYLVSDEGINKRKINEALTSLLPQHMIPSFYKEIHFIPLSPNGKTDFKALAPIEEVDFSTNEQYVAPRNNMEKKLAAIWTEVLGIERISTTNNFFELGGHSLSAIKTVSRIKYLFKAEVTIMDFFQYPTIQEFSQLLDNATGRKLPPIESNPYPENIPLSFAQERLWFIDKFEGSQHYHVPVILDIKGNLDTAILENSFNEIINRHEVLRTVFTETDGIPYQKILSKNIWQLQHYKPDNSQSIDDFIENAVNKPFDLSRDFLVRAVLIEEKEKQFKFVLVMHHIITDGWSSPIFINELVAVYKAKTQQQEAILPKLNIQYADYAIWQKKYLNEDFFAEKLKFWKDNLKGVAKLQLPYDFPRTAEKNNDGDTISNHIEKKLYDSVVAFSHQEEVTVFMVLMAAIKILFHKYTAQNDICLGSVIANRNQIEVEPLIGFFVNSLPIRSNISSQMSFREIVQEVKRTTLLAFSNQDVPFEKIVETCVEGREINTTPIFQVLMTLQNNEIEDEVNLDDISITPVSLQSDSSKLDITFNISETENGLNISATYNTTLFLRSSMEQMVDRYKVIIEACMHGAGKKIEDIAMHTINDTVFLETQNTSSVHYPQDETFLDLFRESVAHFPENTAVVFEDKKLTYKQLDEKSNQLAHMLKDIGVSKETLVAISLDRSLDAIIAIYGVLKAGAAFVPIDTTYPKNRILYILEDTKAVYAITNTHYKELFDESRVSNCIIVDDSWPALNQFSTTALDVKIDKNDLIYILYTSGSTGNPKGVSLRHFSIVDHIFGVLNFTNFESSDTFLLTSSFSADGGYTLVFGVAIFGKSLHIISNDLLLDRKSLKSYIVNHSIDCIKTVPSLWLSYAEDKSYLIPNKTLILGGEVFPLKIVQLLKDCDYQGKVYNNYGPTETTIGKVMHEVKLNTKYTNIPIGRPISNTKLYVVNSLGELCPVGIPGELWIGGDGVAKGYFGKDALTAEKFIPNCFSTTAEIVYKTGDVVKWLPDGEIEFIGRVDEQVQIRGYRVELSEIENTILRVEGVAQAAVIIKDIIEKQILAFVVGENIDTSAIIGYLKLAVPDYMLPAVIIEVDEIPLTKNAKTDKKRLLELTIGEQEKSRIEVFQNETEEKLGEIWKQVLKTEIIGRNSNFFELGGHSLKAVQVISAIKEKFIKNISIKDLFLNSTISQLAVIVSDSHTIAPSLSSISRQRGHANVPLSFSQERLWILDKIHGSINYHIPLIVKLEHHVKDDILEKSFRALMKRHEILRTVLVEKENEVYQEVISEEDWSLKYLKIHDSPIEQFIRSEIEIPFDLSDDYLLRAQLIENAENGKILLIVLHHIVTDGWSMPIFTSELATIYTAFARNEIPKLEDLPIQYADYSLWQRKYFNTDFIIGKMAFWENYLKNIEKLDFPLDYSRPALMTTEGGAISFTFKKALYDKIQKMSHEEGTSLFIFLLTIFNILLYKYTNKTDVCVGTPNANRSNKEVERLIGCFINTVPLRTIFHSEISFKNLLDEVKRTTLDAFENGEIPFEKIVEKLIKERDISQNPIFQVMFHLQNNDQVQFDTIQNIISSEFSFQQTTSKFDLSFHLAQVNENLNLTVEYSSQLFRESTINRLIEHYENLVEAAISSPEKPISELNILSQEEEQKLKNMFFYENALPEDLTVLDLFYDQVANRANSIAAVSGNSSISYRDLNIKSNILSNYLLDKSEFQEPRAILFMDRGIEYLISMLGVWKAGYCFTPLNPNFPEIRNKEIKDQVKCNIIITTRDYLLNEAFNTLFYDAQVICVEDIINNPENSSSKPLNKVSPDMLSYIYFTSGSSGKPKGAMVEHSGMLNHMMAKINDFDVTNHDTVAQTAAHTFDVSIWQFITPLLVGGKTIILNDEEAWNPELLIRNIQQNRITIYESVPAHFSIIIDYLTTVTSLPQLPTLRNLMMNGEALPIVYCEKWFKLYPAICMSNVYGPTECSDDVTHFIFNEISPKWSSYVPIGKPIQNTKIYILDEALKIVPKGLIGEIYVAGSGVGRGYIINDSSNTSPFMIDHIKGYGRMYKTGDLGRWNSDGFLEFNSRKDTQVKIRGNRIELSEVEFAIHSCENIKDAVIIIQEKDMRKSLIAFIVVENDIETDYIDAFLKTVLPDYMIPDIFIKIDEIPLTTNGKIDRNKLSAINITYDKKLYLPPTTIIENKLVSIWQKLLKIDKIGINDNFFELGGDSIVAIQAVGYAKKEGIFLKPRDIFQYQTIKEMAFYIENESSTAIIGEQGILSGEVKLSPIQRHFFEEIYTQDEHFNQSILLNIKKTIKDELIKDAFDLLVSQHDSLRLQYKLIENNWYQEYGEMTNYFSVESLPKNMEKEECIAKLSQKYHQLINLREGILFKIIFIKTPDDEADNRLLLIAHHLIIDAVSLRLLIADLEKLLSYAENNQPLLLGEKTTSYREWVNTLTDLSKMKSIKRDILYWQKITNNDLPLVYSKNFDMIKNVKETQISVSDELTQILTKETYNSYNVSVNEILIAALLRTISELCKVSTVTVGIENHGRNSIDEATNLSETTGWFTNMYPITFDHTDEDNLGGLIKSTKEQFRGTPNEGITYGILRYMTEDTSVREKMSAVKIDLVFNYLGQINNTQDVNSLLSFAEESTSENIGSQTRFNYKLIINCLIFNERLIIVFRYLDIAQNASFIKNLSINYSNNLQLLISHCQNKIVSELTPDDLGLGKDINVKELEEFFEEGEDILQF